MSVMRCRMLSATFPMPLLPPSLGPLPRKPLRLRRSRAATVVGILFLFPTWSQVAARPGRRQLVAPPAPARREASPRSVLWVDPNLPPGPGLTHQVLASQVLGHDVGYVVWTPVGYDATKRYPVVYFLHGVPGTEAADAAGFSSYVAKGIAAGAIMPTLVVFPNGGASGYRGKVERMIVFELVPLIDKTYPTLATAKSRAVVGFSVGGSGAIRLALLHPKLFAAAASWAGRGGAGLTTALAKHAVILRRRGFGVLLLNGEKDHPDAFRPLVARCGQLGLACTLSVLPGVDHDLGAYYETSHEQVMKFLGDHLQP